MKVLLQRTLLALGVTALLAAGMSVTGFGDTAEAGQCKKGKVHVAKWGCIPKSVYKQAKKNCAKYGAPPAGCLCQDGSSIGACGD